MNMILLFGCLIILLFYCVHQHDFTIPSNSCLWRKTLQITVVHFRNFWKKYSNEQQTDFQQRGLKLKPLSQKPPHVLPTILTYYVTILTQFYSSSHTQTATFNQIHKSHHHPHLASPSPTSMPLIPKLYQVLFLITVGINSALPAPQLLWWYFLRTQHWTIAFNLCLVSAPLRS